MKTIKSMLYGVYGSILAVGLLAASPAHALVTEGDASAYVVQATIFDEPFIGPVPYSSVSGNGADADSIASVSVGSILSTGLLSTSAFSNVDGSPGSKTATASSSIADFEFKLSHALGLSFDLISSNSTVTGDAGSFSAVGNSSIVNLAGFGLLSGLNNIVITGAANQTLFSLFGIEVIANRQTSTCTATDCFITTDALFVDVLGKKNLTIASSTAHLAAPIPEPETAALMMIGLAGLVGSKRLRSKMLADA
jgi:hypothetical protein